MLETQTTDLWTKTDRAWVRLEIQCIVKLSTTILRYNNANAKNIQGQYNVIAGGPVTHMHGPDLQA